MIQRPGSLAAFTLDLVREIAASGISESDWFDLKADLQGKVEHQRKVVAAFANTQGGFLVFGVTNDRRVVGVKNTELIRDFGNKLHSGLNPSASFDFAPPLQLQEEGYAIWICYIPRSQRGPHAVQENNAWAFPKRTESGSCVSMSVEEIRLAFQDTEMRRSKLALVASELELLESIAARTIARIPDGGSAEIDLWVVVGRYPTELIDSVLGDAFAILANSDGIWAKLAYVREAARSANAMAEFLGNICAVPLNNDSERLTMISSKLRDSSVKLSTRAMAARQEIVAYLRAGT